MAMVGNNPGVVGGASQKPDNTGRDWGEAMQIGGITAGAVLGSVLSFGTAAAPLAAAAAVGDSAVIAANVAKDVQQNKTDANEAQRAQQGALDKLRNVQAPAMPTPGGGPVGMQAGGALHNAATPMPGAQVNIPSTKGLDFSGFNKPPAIEQTPGAIQMPEMNFGGTPPPVASDKRVKTRIVQGHGAAEDFLSAVRRMNAWPKDIKDTQ